MTFHPFGLDAGQWDRSELPQAESRTNPGTFPNIAFHVVQSPWIWEAFADGVSCQIAVRRIPRVIRQACVYFFSGSSP